MSGNQRPLTARQGILRFRAQVIGRLISQGVENGEENLGFPIRQIFNKQVIVEPSV